MTQIPEEVRDIVQAEMGEDGLTILENLAEMGSATDTDLAELLDTRTSTIRKALYQLYEQRIADYEENRDPSNGWLTFVWSYTPEQAMRSLEEAKQEAAQEIQAEIEATASQEHFVCPEGHTRLDFARAMDLEFHCPDCGLAIEPEDREQRVAQLESQLASLQGNQAEA